MAAFIEAGARRDFLLALDKGTLVYVEGDAKMDQYTDAEGKERRALNIVHRELLRSVGGRREGVTDVM